MKIKQDNRKEGSAANIRTLQNTTDQHEWNETGEKRAEFNTELMGLGNY